MLLPCAWNTSRDQITTMHNDIQYIFNRLLVANNKLLFLYIELYVLHSQVGNHFIVVFIYK